MKLPLSTTIAAFACMILVSCYPYNETQNRRKTGKPPQKSITSPEQQKIQGERDKLKAKQELKTKEELAETPPSTANDTETKPELPKPQGEEKRTDYAFANKVPGKEGFVFSPYNNKIVDVRDIPSGTLVQDPTYTGAGKGYFRVP